uniref:Uncharacterized protein n=1 Tax=Rhizophora mucronata TaxID=61149 RepID=A0A2P2IW08_RHIMU
MLRKQLILPYVIMCMFEEAHPSIILDPRLCLKASVRITDLENT